MSCSVDRARSASRATSVCDRDASVAMRAFARCAGLTWSSVRTLTPWHPDYVTEAIRKLILDSGLPRIRPLQDLRHTHAALLLADGENAKVVQERLGHRSHSFTADTYQRVMPGMDGAAAARFEGLVFRGQREPPRELQI